MILDEPIQKKQINGWLQLGKPTRPTNHNDDPSAGGKSEGKGGKSLTKGGESETKGGKSETKGGKSEI